MVGVSDDVNEYAMALRDTEDKLRRCPKRVRLGRKVALEQKGVAQGQYAWGSLVYQGIPQRKSCSGDAPTFSLVPTLTTPSGESKTG